MLFGSEVVEWYTSPTLGAVDVVPDSKGWGSSPGVVSPKKVLEFVLYHITQITNIILAVF